MKFIGNVNIVELPDFNQKEIPYSEYVKDRNKGFLCNFKDTKCIKIGHLWCDDCEVKKSISVPYGEGSLWKGDTLMNCYPII
jgi:hypothetical protein